MKITVKKLSELHKPAHNIRRHSEKQLTEYIRSIEMFGQVKPLVVAEDGEIIAGNGLYEALLRMGRETCDCYVMVGLTDVQKKKLMMADNKVYELGFTDVDAIEELVKELDGDVDVPGWDADLLEMLNSTEDEADEMIGSYGESLSIPAAAVWWLRSPNYNNNINNNNYFCAVSSSGSLDYNNANNAYGVVPGFCHAWSHGVAIGERRP